MRLLAHQFWGVDAQNIVENRMMSHVFSRSMFLRTVSKKYANRCIARMLGADSPAQFPRSARREGFIRSGSMPFGIGGSPERSALIRADTWGTSSEVSVFFSLRSFR